MNNQGGVVNSTSSSTTNPLPVDQPLRPAELPVANNEMNANPPVPVPEAISAVGGEVYNPPVPVTASPDAVADELKHIAQGEVPTGESSNTTAPLPPEQLTPPSPTGDFVDPEAAPLANPAGQAEVSVPEPAVPVESAQPTAQEQPPNPAQGESRVESYTKTREATAQAGLKVNTAVEPPPEAGAPPAPNQPLMSNPEPAGTTEVPVNQATTTQVPVILNTHHGVLGAIGNASSVNEAMTTDIFDIIWPKEN